MRKIILSSAALLAFGVMAPTAALAADLPSIKVAPVPAELAAPNGWRFEAVINGWTPSLIANVGVGRFPTVESNVGFFKILEKLNGVVPISVIGYNDNFIVGADLYWAALSAGGHLRASNTVLGDYGGLSAKLHIEETFLTGFGGVRLPIQAPDLKLYGIVGFRLTNVATALDLNTALPGLGLACIQSEIWADPIIGLTRCYDLNAKWFLTGEADIGGADKSATWKTFGALGYNWSQSIKATLGFRALYVDYQKSNDRR